MAFKSLLILRTKHKEEIQASIKMFSRYFAAFCVLVVVVLALHASETEAAKGPAQVVAKIIGKQFAKAGGRCLADAAEQCKHHWKNPNAAIQCGRDFLHNNRGRCAAGK